MFKWLGKSVTEASGTSTGQHRCFAARHISGNNLVWWATEKFWWILAFVGFRKDWFTHSCCWHLQNSVVAHITKTGFAFCYRYYWICSHSTGFIIELWVHLRNTVSDKTLHSTPSNQCRFVVISWFGYKEKLTRKDNSSKFLLFKMCFPYYAVRVTLNFIRLYDCTWETRVHCPFLMAVKPFCSEE